MKVGSNVIRTRWTVASLLYAKAAEADDSISDTTINTHLRSAQEVTGYHIVATDGDVGHVEDFVIDNESWKVRYVIIDTRNWLPGRKVIIPPEWIDRVQWEGRTAHVPFSIAQIRNAPEFDPHAPVNHEFEVRLYDYYGRPYN